MSRVKKPGQKWVNMPKHDSGVCGISKMTRIHVEGEDYHKCSTLSKWLFVKYDMSYGTYRNKSSARRNELRREFAEDTGVDIRTPDEKSYGEAMSVLKECGVPFSPDGTPLGIGWDD